VIDAVLLDLGNVLIFHDNALLFRRLAEKAGLDAAEVARRFSEELWPPLITGRADEERIRAEVNRSLGTRLDVDEFFAIFNSHFSVHDAVLPLVSRLCGKVKLGLLSNTNAVHARWVRSRLPLLERFDAVLFSHEVGLAKPDPAFYRAALARLATDPSRTVFFDDIPEFVEAARRLGMRAEVFTTAPAFAQALAGLGVRLA
jgi:FMN phosphatase YigB (HAD superfamily)